MCYRPSGSTSGQLCEGDNSARLGVKSTGEYKVTVPEQVDNDASKGRPQSEKPLISPS